MFTITPRTRIREGISWEDDRCTTGYEIINSDGEVIYDFADESTKDYYEELNKKEKENTMKTTFKTIEQNINNLRRDYGEMIFRMSISHLMDVGMRNLTPELVNEAKDEIMKQDDGKMFVTNELLCNVVECAGELAKIDATYLLVYIGKNVEYDVDECYRAENEEGDED
jgi:hypothetical protein